MTAQGRTTSTFYTDHDPAYFGWTFCLFSVTYTRSRRTYNHKELVDCTSFLDIWGTRRCRRDLDARPIQDTVVMRSDEERNNVHQNRFKN